jgi:hypothetical protein
MPPAIADQGAGPLKAGVTCPRRIRPDSGGDKTLNKWIRQVHRWLSIIFTVTVIANMIALTTGDKKAPDWITYSPLLPLGLLLLTGLYLFVLPYVLKRRS